MRLLSDELSLNVVDKPIQLVNVNTFIRHRHVLGRLPIKFLLLVMSRIKQGFDPETIELGSPLTPLILGQ